ncbi:MAG: radical SAM protein [Acidimicrobiia bacterium]|nr:radical SAM protein [Acidimicrobiia bacterium]
MNVLLISTYELGHQPLGIAAPAAALSERGHDVRLLDLAIDDWDQTLVDWADRVAISVPMHTATRLAREIASRVDRPLAGFGLYAGMCSDFATTLVSRDPVSAVVGWIDDDPTVKVPMPVPAREQLPAPDQYAHLLRDGERFPIAYVEASQGCVHRCRHCPVPVVYDGRIRITDVETVLADVEQQVNDGARHVTFGDPDFFNGVHHARRVVEAVHAAYPLITFDCTVKVEHILRDESIWPWMAEHGCLFVISAFESVNDAILTELDKGHTAADGARAIAILRAAGIEPRPTWLPFTPWSTADDIRAILDFVAEHDLIGNVDPVQFSIRLLVPEGSLLVGRIEGLGEWNPESLSYGWTSPIDQLAHEFAAVVERGADDPAGDVFNALRALVELPAVDTASITDAPRLSESWFCCAEPTAAQLRAV